MFKNRTGLIIEDIEYIGEIDDYVYDLETEDGTYYAGDGIGILAKNTDSIMVAFPVHNHEFIDQETGLFDNNAYMKENFKIGKECADAITKSNKVPISIELEKGMTPFNLITKKRYIYVEWSICKIHGAVMSSKRPENKPGFEMCESCKKYHTLPSKERPQEQDVEGMDVIKFKGFVLARRDTCQYVKNACLRILELAMLNITPDNKDACIEAAKKYSLEAVDKLLKGNVDINDLKLSKSLKGSYKVSKAYNGPKVIEGQTFFGLKDIGVSKAMIQKKTTNMEKTTKSSKSMPSGPVFNFTVTEKKEKKTGGKGCIEDEEEIFNNCSVAEIDVDNEVVYEGEDDTDSNEIGKDDFGHSVLSKNIEEYDSDDEVVDPVKNISVKWDNVYCAKCEVELPDPTFNQIKGCPDCPMCKPDSRCKLCASSTNFVKFPHVRIGKKLKMLNPMDHITPPGRVPYVFVKVDPSIPSSQIKQCDRVEHPEYLIENGIKKEVDYMYYFEHQLKEPLCQIMDVILQSTDSGQLYKDLVIFNKNRAAGTRSITSMFKKVSNN